jgi:hypothetical protein
VGDEKGQKVWWNRLVSGPSNAEKLHTLADWCENLAATDQRAGFGKVIDELDFGPGVDAAMERAARQWVVVLADSGAFESAAVALIPRSAIYSGGRMADGQYVAQVILQGGVAAHSRAARSLSMAWVAALLRALARQSIEANAAQMN